jgi:hypothetical protein
MGLWPWPQHATKSWRASSSLAQVISNAMRSFTAYMLLVGAVDASTLVQRLPSWPAYSAPVSGPVHVPSGQKLFVGLTRHWSRMDPELSARMVAGAGAHGRSYELLELEPPGLGNSGMYAYMQQQAEQIGPHLRADKTHGLLSKIYWWNTNTRKQDQLTSSQHKALIDLFCKKYGGLLGNVVMLAMNENDQNTPGDVQSGITAYWRSKPVNSTVLYEKAGASWAEYHPQKFGSYPGPGSKSTILAPDCGPVLAALTQGSIQGRGGKPDKGKWREFIRTAWRQGKSVDAYNFFGSMDPTWVAACCEVLDQYRDPPR